MIRKWIEKKLHLRGRIPDFIKTPELAAFLVCKGMGTYLRGFLHRWRFKVCGGRLFVGADTRFYFPRFISLGRDIFIGAHCTINGLAKEGIVIGNRVHIREYAYLQATSQLDDPGKGIVIGDDVYLGPNCLIGAGGGVHIGKGVVAGANVQFLAENHSFSDISIPIREQGVTRKGIQIEKDVWIGNHVIILDGVKIGEGSVIAAGSVVTHEVLPNSIMAGNPAKLIRMRS